MKLAICPYCGKKVPYFRLFVMKTKCDYICANCKRESKISIDRNMKRPFYGALLISALIIIVNMINKSTDNLTLLALSFMPIVIFYLIVPFYIKLKPYIKYRDIVCERLKNQKQIEREERAARRARKMKTSGSTRKTAKSRSSR